jgi:hypothetical protein
VLLLLLVLLLELSLLLLLLVLLELSLLLELLLLMLLELLLELLLLWRWRRRRSVTWCEGCGGYLAWTVDTSCPPATTRDSVRVVYLILLL